MDKMAARASALEARDRIAAEERAEKCGSICSELASILDDALRSYENVTGEPGVCYHQKPFAVALYQSMKSEVSIDRFIETVYDRGLSACFPCMMRPSPTSEGKGPTMVFREVSREQYELGGVAFLDRPLRSFDTDDPDISPFPAVDPPLLDMVVVPLVAFDSKNSRLGYGGGNYDKLLPNLRDNAIVVGVAFEEQRIDEVPCDLHDQKLPRIVSE